MVVPNRVKQAIIILVSLVFFVLPYKWIYNHVGLGMCFDDPICWAKDLIWEPLRGLFLWPFEDIWTEVGMQMVMTVYTLFGLGIVINYLVFTKMRGK